MMKKGANVWSFIVILTVVGLMFSGLIDTTSATSEKTTVSVTDLSPWFTKDCYSENPWWWLHQYEETHDYYISTYVGGMSRLGGKPSEPNCWAKFKPDLSQSGKYEVYAYFYAWKYTSTKVPFTVKYDGGSTTIKVNQSRSSPAWKEESLGTWYFKAGQDSYVEVTDATGDPYDNIHSLTIGAIKFVKKETVLTPVVTGIDPSQPTARPAKQWITIKGTGFVSDSIVTLRIGSSTYPIPAGHTEFKSSIQIRVKAGLTDPGTWSAQVTNPGNRISNLFSFTVKQEIPSPAHDMAVTNVYTTPSSPNVGQSTTIHVTVKNEGRQQENYVPVKAYVDGYQVGSAQYVTLTDGKSTTKSFTWTPSTAKTYSVKGEVEIVNGEIDVKDNTKIIKVRVSAVPTPTPTPSSSPSRAPKVSQSVTISVKRSTYGSGQIETLDLENQYLPVVVACENGNAPYESMKAQAVAARTFAMYKKNHPRSKNFDIYDDQRDQEYNPSVTVTNQHRQSVTDTNEVVLEYTGDYHTIICAFYVSGTGSTAQYVTYNDGKSGNDITQTSLGHTTNPPSRFPDNRGCMGQVQANNLASSNSYNYPQILKYFYGSDIEGLGGSNGGTTYNPLAAVNYAEVWWNGRNSNNPDLCDPYKDYGGYDCANFVSQCLIAGGLDLSGHPGAYSCECIPTCTNLHDYFVNYLGATWETKPEGQEEPLWFVPGDPAIFGYSDEHPRTHAVFAVTGDATNYAICNAHSDNLDHKSIKNFYSIYPSLDRCTFYHIPTQPVQKPTVETRSATSITETAATLKGEITDDGGASIDERRFSWGTTSSCSEDWITDDPSSDHYGYFDISGNSFSYRLTGLDSDKTYYFQAWAHNSAGWSNGAVLSFRTLIEKIFTGPSTLEFANLNPEGELSTSLYKVIKQVLDVERAKMELEGQQEDILFNHIDTLLKQLDPEQQDKDLIIKDIVKDEALSENEEFIVDFLGGISGVGIQFLSGVPAPFLGEGAKWLGLNIGEQLILKDLHSGTVKKPEIGRMEIVYDETPKNKIWINIFLTDREDPIFITIPVVSKPLRTSWGNYICSPMWCGLTCPPEAAERALCPTIKDVQVIGLYSPGELRVYDSHGRVTGLVKRKINEEIPNSAYFNNTVILFFSTDSYRYEVVGTDTGTYSLSMTSAEELNVIDFTATDVPTTLGAIHNYTIDWDALSQGEKGATVKIDSDGDDVVEHTIITNNSFHPLIAEFTFSPKNPLIGEKVTLDASTSFDLGGGVIKKYRWEFYNAANQDPFYVIEGHDKEIIRYTFTSKGIYRVRLTVTDDEGEYSYTESSITIKESIKEPVFYVPDDYPSIQAAVDAANAGDTIIVRDGTYTENVDIDKSITLKSSSGNPEYTIVKPVDPFDDVFSVTADHVKISGFTVTEAEAPAYVIYIYAYGIYLYNADYCDISDNICSHRAFGIYLEGSNSNSISDNTCINNEWVGISLNSSTKNSISNNTCSNNGCGGICLACSTKNSISNNTCSNNGYGGICLECCNQNSISNNLCCNNELGIGIYPCWVSDNNCIYLNNFINNDCNAYSHSSTDTWYSPVKLSYTYNGESHTNYLGNYWSDYTGTDANKNGIGDSPYSIDTDQDDYPLMTVSGRYFNPSPTIPTPPTSTLTPTPRATLAPSPTLTPTPRPTLRPTATLFEKIEGLTAAIRVGVGI